MRRIVVGLGLVLAMVVPVTTGSAGASSQSAVATPNRHLVDGQVVTVSWSGFSAKPPTRGGEIIFKQCNSNYRASPSTLECSLSNVGSAPWAASGSSQYTVHTGTIRDGTCGTSTTDRKCAILVMGISTHGTMFGRNQAVAWITFAPPASSSR